FFDWAINEECANFDECGLLVPFIEAGKAVFHVEYGAASLADRICPQANALDFDTLIKNLDLDAWRVPCR
ncbi:MAG: endo alpha-1,4 polygalactosaminidase, partial [Deltaproteobacteria bacterium]|nr:endo alpha-1,4 polygalactosaminidase [Deltaproteobacteria bacterium]